jgi:hypothetical protein
VNSIQDLQRQLRVINEQNKNLLRQLKQNQDITINESGQNVCNFNYNFKKKLSKIKTNHKIIL